MLAAGRTFKELSDKAFRQADEFVAHRYACIAHGVGMTDEYPRIPYCQDWDQLGYNGDLVPGAVISVESFVGSEHGEPGQAGEHVSDHRHRSGATVVVPVRGGTAPMTKSMTTPPGEPNAILGALAATLEGAVAQVERAAAYVLDNPGEIAVNSMRTLADAAGVKPNTLVRMARAVGFDGYEDFREPLHSTRRRAHFRSPTGPDSCRPSARAATTGRWLPTWPARRWPTSRRCSPPSTPTISRRPPS